MKTVPEMNTNVEMNTIGNETVPRNELEMNGGNEPEMKTRLEMNEGLEMNRNVEMNAKTYNRKHTNKQIEGDNMTYTDEDLIKKVEQIEDPQIKEEILNIINSETCYIDINSVKQEVQSGYSNFISGIKIVTTENKDIVLHTIKKDIMVHPNSCAFIIRDYIIDLTLDNNATLYSYYFINPEVLKEVLEELPRFNLPIQKSKIEMLK